MQIDQVTIKDWENMAIECGFTSAFVRRRVKDLSQTLLDASDDVIDALLQAHPLLRTGGEHHSKRPPETDEYK